MTDEAKALVERLREQAWTITDMEAADLIETQAREIDRLINAGDGDVGLIHWQGERIEALKAEIERLREALREIIDFGDGDTGYGNSCAKIARAALGDNHD